MPSLGPTELILILVIVMIIFGPGKLAGLGSSLGKSIREFRKATTEPDEEEEVVETTTTVTAKPAVEEPKTSGPPTVAIVEETPSEPANQGNKAT